MLLGKILAAAAMKENKFVTWLPAYGAEVRGGTAHCMLVISDQEVGSPYVYETDTLIVMNRLSYEKFEKRVKKGGLVVLNSSLADKSPESKIKTVARPFTDIAVKAGNIRVANMIALGSYLAARNTVAVKNVLEVIDEFAPADKKNLVAINQAALKKGMELENG